jgi:hypothetical protein
MQFQVSLVIALCLAAMYALMEESKVPPSILEVYSIKSISTPRVADGLREMDATTVHRPIHICLPPTPAIATTRFAIVSTIRSNHTGYMQAAAKLGVSVRGFSNMDMVMIAANLGNAAPKVISDAGWTWCDVQPIDDLESTTTYTRLRAWQLTEYEAILFLSADCIVLSDFSQLFSTHLPIMEARGVEVAMVR